VDGAETPAFDDLRAVEDPDGEVGIAGIDGEEHAPNRLAEKPLTGVSRLAP